MELTSDAFEPGGDIPKKYSCAGDDVSPPLSWTGAPARTRAFALICEDPDAPAKTFTHWVLYDLPGDRMGLPEGLPADERLPGGERQGKNGFGRAGYGGPCPPTGPAHRYYFTLFALDRPLDLEPGASKAEVEKAMEGRVLEKAQLMGRYRKVGLATFARALLGR